MQEYFVGNVTETKSFFGVQCHPRVCLKGNILPPGIDPVLQINAYLIRVHALSDAKCFSDLLGVYILRPDSSEMLPYGEKKKKT